MSCELRNEWITNKDVDTVVDEAFAFIYDEAISGRSSPIPTNNSTSDLDNLDVIVDKHFSFLNKLNYNQKDASEPIYENVCSNYRAEVDIFRSESPTIIGTPQKLDIHISNSDTNIHNGNTIINIPRELRDDSNLSIKSLCSSPKKNCFIICPDSPKNCNKTYLLDKNTENGADNLIYNDNVCLEENEVDNEYCNLYSLDQPDGNLCNKPYFSENYEEFDKTNYEIIGTPQNLDIHISNSGTNIHNGNTIINIPRELRDGSNLSIKSLCSSPKKNCFIICPDSPKNYNKTYLLDKNSENYEEFDKTNYEISGSLKRFSDKDGDVRGKRFCPDIHSNMEEIPCDSTCNLSNVEMNVSTDALYVEPSSIQVPSTMQFNGRLNDEGVTPVDLNNSIKYSREIYLPNENCENNNELEIRCDNEYPNMETVNIDNPETLLDDLNIESCDNRSNDGIGTFIEARNDLLGTNLSPSLEIVSKNFSQSAASHLEKLLYLDKEVENIDSQPKIVCFDGIYVVKNNEADNETITMSSKCSIAEALNPNILCDEIKNTQNDTPETEQQPNLERSDVSHSSETLPIGGESHEEQINTEPQTNIIIENDPHPQCSTIDKGSSVDHPVISVLDDDIAEDTGFAASVSRAIRRSMRRMRQIRLSGRRSKRTSTETFAYYNEGIVSEETEVRRDVPEAPTVGLPSVRSPAASAILLPSIMATLAPMNLPTENPSGSGTSEIDADFQSSQSADSINDHTYNRSDSDSGQQNDLADHRTELARQQEPSSSPPPGYGAAIQSSSLNTRSTDGELQNIPLIQQSRNSRDRNRRLPTGQDGENSRNYNLNLSRENLVHRDNTTVRPLATNRSRSTGRSSTSSVETASDPSLLNERRNHSIGSPSRQSSQTSNSISGFIPPRREYWPHSFSCLLASLPLTLNVFNISRFALFGAKYGWQFPIQWGIISLVFGLPLMVFHMAVGQLIGAGPIDMWVISPIFQGVGYGVLIAEALLGVYCCIPIAWMFTYFRESFDMGTFRCITSYDCENPHNLSAEINQVVPQFFVSNILALSENHGVPLANLGTIHFNLAFNLLIIWIILFVALSRGAKTLGKICYLSTLLPFICFNAVCCYLIYIAFTQLPVVSFFPRFLDKQSWMAAAREAFLVWALHGAALQQLAAGNRKGHPLWRDTTIIALLTGSGLFLASFCGIVCSTVLHDKSLRFSPSSFETPETRTMTEVRNWISKNDISYGGNRASHIYDMFTPQDVYDNFYVGIRIRKQFIEPDDDGNRIRSGYNSIRFLTEMFPALLFTLKSPIEATIPPLFYLCLLMFGLAHQMSVWYAVIQGVIRMQYTRLRAIETFLTFCCCVFGFSAALPLATGAGMNVLYFLDFIVGAGWWLMILQLIYIFGILLVRGKPFSAADVATELFGSKGVTCALRHALSLCWTVLVPVGLVVATISSFQAGDYRQVFTWECSDWPVWVCQLASALQLFPLVLVPLFGIVKTCIFLSHPTQNFLQKLEFLYRPPPYRELYLEDDTFLNEDADDSLDIFRSELIHQPNRRRNPPVLNDPPPKYTPPPSYSTATGSSLAKSLENTIRRSYRYLRRHPSRANPPPPPR